ncbi:MAG: VOC family protein [Acidobacteriota bacterium]
MFEIQQLDHLVIRVRNLETMVQFYCEVVGCSMDKRNEDLGLAHLRAGKSMIDLISVDGKLGLAGGKAPENEGHNLDHLCLRIEPFDLASLLAHLQKHRVEASALYHNYGAEGYGPSLYIRDPEGNTIEFKGAPDPQSEN